MKKPLIGLLMFSLCYPMFHRGRQAHQVGRRYFRSMAEARGAVMKFCGPNEKPAIERASSAPELKEILLDRHAEIVRGFGKDPRFSPSSIVAEAAFCLIDAEVANIAQRLDQMGK